MNAKETTDDYLLKLGQKIQRIRKEKGINQADLAQITEIHRSTIIRIESGQINSTIIMLRKISFGLGIELHELVQV